jgi:hypothetical protein
MKKIKKRYSCHEYTKEIYKKAKKSEQLALELEAKKIVIYNRFMKLMRINKKSNLEENNSFRSYHYKVGSK